MNGFDVPDFIDLSLEEMTQPLVDTEAFVHDETERVEYAIRGAILAGYDGVDVHRKTPGIRESLARKPLSDTIDIGIASIDPWNYPAPDADNGLRTERYCWDWFSEDTLVALATGETHPHDALPGGDDE